MWSRGQRKVCRKEQSFSNISVKNHSAYGLTLIELLVVLSIVVSVLGLAAINLFRQTSVSLGKTAQGLETLISVARTQAILQGKTVRIAIDPEERIIKMEGLDPRSGIYVTPLQVSRSITVKVSESALHSDGGTRYFEFFSDGSASPGDVELLMDGSQSLVVVIPVLPKIAS